MITNDPQAQETRTLVVGVAVTPSEKAAVRAVASAHEISESEVLRTRTMDEVLEQYARIRQAIATSS